MWSSLAVKGLKQHMMSFIFTESQPQWHAHAAICKCHKQSQITQDTVKPSCLSEKSISKQVH